MLKFPERPTSYNDDIYRMFGGNAKNVTFITTHSCNFACSYCTPGNTAILMGDRTLKPIMSVCVGDQVYSFPEIQPGGKKHAVSEIATVDQVYKRSYDGDLINLILSDGKSLRLTPEHKVKYRSSLFKPARNIRVGDSLYVETNAETLPDTPLYDIGYFIGILVGDGSLTHHISKVGGYDMYRFRIAQKDTEIVDKCKLVLSDLGIDYHMINFKISTKYNMVTPAIFAASRGTFNAVTKLREDYFGKCNDAEYLRGFLSGIYDAEGHISSDASTIRISNTDDRIINEITRALNYYNLSHTLEAARRGCNKPVFNIRLLCKNSNTNFRFISLCNPKVYRKGVSAFIGKNVSQRVRVVNVFSEHFAGDVYNIGTSNHTYFANNILVHNCYEHCKSNNAMDIQTAKKAIDLLFDEDTKNGQYVNANDAAGLILDFIGGEPLLTIGLIDQICDYFLYRAIDLNHRWANRFMISMSSNGSCYFSPAVQAFMQKWAGRVNISITIDGNKELHDSCRRTIAGEPTYDAAAAAFADAKVRFNQTGTKLTLSPENIKYLSMACIDMIEKFDLGQLHGNPIFEAEWTVDEAGLYYAELKKLADWMISTERWKKTWVAFFDEYAGHKLPEEDNQGYCGGAGKMLAFDVDGSIYPCMRFAPLSMGDEKAKHCVIGHVDTGLVQHECEKCFMNELCAITRRSQSSDECWNCPIGSGCATCSAWQYETYGDANRRCTNICHMHKARVLATAYYFNTLYRKYREAERFKLNVPADWAIPIVGEDEYKMLLSLASDE